MNISSCYSILEVAESASDEEISKAYKRLAHQYHPDKNRDRTEWATRAMATLNLAYTTVRSHRFSTASRGSKEAPSATKAKTAGGKEETPRRQDAAEEYRNALQDEMLIKQFIDLRESAKDSLYKYFQYSLYNILRRENALNRGMFADVVNALRKSYHEINKLYSLTGDDELRTHFKTFNTMIFNFYRASECLTVPDSYSDLVDVEAFRMYKKGDEALHAAHKEVFYDRHNRGTFRRDSADGHIMRAEFHFREAIRRYPQSSWAVETKIKLDYVESLKLYIMLFFSKGTG
jgi:hypothetical protein